jgi:type I restriction enzyme R subunit
MWKTRLSALIILIIGVGVAFFVYSSEPRLNTSPHHVNAPASFAKFPFKLGLDLSGGTHLVYKADVSKLDPADVKDSMDSLRDVIERRVNLFGVSEPVVQVQEGGIASTDAHRLIVDLPGVTDINKAIDSSVELRNKKDLINQFISALDVHSVVDDDWHKFVDEKKIEELEQIIANENLDRDATYTFVRNAFRDGNVATTGTAITKVLPPVSRFSPTGERTLKRESVLSKLTNFFERFFDISGGTFSE